MYYSLCASKTRSTLAITLLLLAFPLGIFIEGGYPTHYIIVPLVILMQIYLLQRLRNAQLLLITTLYIQIYFLYLIPYFYCGIELSQYSEYQNPIYFEKIAFLFYIFYAGLVYSTRKAFNPNRKKLANLITISTTPFKQFLYIIFLLISLLLVLRQGQNVLTANGGTYNAYLENLDNVNGLPLFYILFLMIGYYVIGNWKYKTVLLAILSFILIIFCITRGFRMILAPIGLLLFMVFFDMRIRTRTVIILFGIGFLLLILVNNIKMNLTFNIDYIFSEGGHDYIVAHHADNLYVAAAGMGMLDHGDITFFDRILLNIGLLLEAIIPPGMLPDILKYPHIITHTVSTGGGGPFIMGAYLMWGYAGLYIFGYLLGEFVRMTYLAQKPLMAMLCAIIMIFAPRWVSYDFHIILRFSCFAIILYIMLCRQKKY